MNVLYRKYFCKHQQMKCISKPIRKIYKHTKSPIDSSKNSINLSLNKLLYFWVKCLNKYTKHHNTTFQCKFFIPFRRSMPFNLKI